MYVQTMIIVHAFTMIIFLQGSCSAQFRSGAPRNSSRVGGPPGRPTFDNFAPQGASQCLTSSQRGGSPPALIRDLLTKAPHLGLVSLLRPCTEANINHRILTSSSYTQAIDQLTIPVRFGFEAGHARVHGRQIKTVFGDPFWLFHLRQITSEHKSLRVANACTHSCTRSCTHFCSTVYSVSPTLI